MVPVATETGAPNRPSHLTVYGKISKLINLCKDMLSHVSAEWYKEKITRITCALSMIIGGVLGSIGLISIHSIYSQPVTRHETKRIEIPVVPNIHVPNVEAIGMSFSTTLRTKITLNPCITS